MDIEQIKNELKSLGFSDEKIYELMDLAAEEALDTALEDLKNTGDDTTMEELANLMQTTPADANDVRRRIDVIFEKTYGQEAASKKVELITTYLQNVIEDTKKAKDLYARYQAGDPAAIATIKAQEGNPDVQEIINTMQ